MSRLRLIGAVASALVTKPGLWPTALVQMRRFAPDRWWARRPFLPTPDPELVAFRATTQYGERDRTTDAEDVITWLRWCRSEAQRQRR